MNCSALWVINVLTVTISSFQFPINTIGQGCTGTAEALAPSSCSWVAESAQVDPVVSCSGGGAGVLSPLTPLVEHLTTAQGYFHPFVGGSNLKSSDEIVTFKKVHEDKSFSVFS